MERGKIAESKVVANGAASAAFENASGRLSEHDGFLLVLRLLRYSPDLCGIQQKKEEESRARQSDKQTGTRRHS